MLGDPEGAAEMPLAVHLRNRLATDGGAHALGRDYRALQIGVGHDDQELLAAVAPEDVDVAQRARRRRGEALERDVAGGVAVALVDAAEPVEVHAGDRERFADALGARDLALERLYQMVRW